MSEELEKVKPTECYIKVNGEERQIKFTFSAWGKLSEKYGGIQNLAKLEEDMQNNPFTTLPELIYIALVDKTDVTPETALDDYTMADVEEITNILKIALEGSLPKETTGQKKKAVKKQ